MAAEGMTARDERAGRNQQILADRTAEVILHEQRRLLLLLLLACGDRGWSVEGGSFD